MLVVDMLSLLIAALGVILLAPLLVWLICRFTVTRCRTETQQIVAVRIDGVRDEIRKLGQRVARLEAEPVQLEAPYPHSGRGPVSSPALVSTGGRPLFEPPQPPSGPAAVEYSKPAPPPARRSIATLTREASDGLASVEAFRTFAAASGGSGRMLPELRTMAAGEDPSCADIWLVPYDDGALVFPGFNLRRVQTSLMADRGRVAQDRLGGLFEITSGVRFEALTPARFAPGGELAQRGQLSLPE